MREMKMRPFDLKRGPTGGLSPFMKRIYSSSNKGDGDKTFWSFRPYTWFS